MGIPGDPDPLPILISKLTRVRNPLEFVAI